jgi:hypothetical protein
MIFSFHRILPLGDTWHKVTYYKKKNIYRLAQYIYFGKLWSYHTYSGDTLV